MEEADRPRKAMKKKIVLGLSVFAMMFFLGGVYIVTTMETTVSELRRLADVHHNTQGHALCRKPGGDAIRQPHEGGRAALPDMSPRTSGGGNPP
jgi:hypothetical protein